MTTTTYPSTQLLIANQWVDAASGKTIDVRNPATGQVIGTVAHAGIDDLERALTAAQKGFETWRDTSVYERAALMRRATALLRERAGDIARLLTQEQGKPLAEAKGEILAGADILDWFAEEGRRVYGRLVPGRNLAAQQMVIKEPVGPVAAFTPWNFPVNQIVRKMGAALATGCSFLCKAPEETPAAPAALLRCFVDAGLPPGVVGLVFGDPAEISGHLIPHPVIRKVTFTGSTAVGKQLAALAGRHMKRVTMELGGHSPVLVFDDSDIDRAAEMLAKFKVRNAGQVCVSPTRFYVQDGAYEQFLARFSDVLKNIKVGDGLEAGTEMGPLAHERRVPAMSAFIDDARKHGAKVVVGGGPLDRKGFFFAPTVVTDLPDSSMLMTEEPFGPVAPVVRFTDTDEVLRRANSLPFGLSSYVFTNSLKTATKVSNGLEAGMVNINHFGSALAETPFGGIKDSGIGSEGGTETFEGYLVTKFITHI